MKTNSETCVDINNSGSKLSESGLLLSSYKTGTPSKIGIYNPRLTLEEFLYKEYNAILLNYS